jgi:hypothetical protein
MATGSAIPCRRKSAMTIPRGRRQFPRHGVSSGSQLGHDNVAKTGPWEPKLSFHEIARIYGGGGNSRRTLAEDQAA